MNKLFWIEEGRLAGRCGPSVAPMDLSALMKAGFRYILSLDASENALLGAGNGALEIELLHLPNSVPPLPEERRVFQRLLPEGIGKIVKRVRENRGAVLVHCHAGCDRTGGVLAGYLMAAKGLGPEAALEEVRKANPLAVSAFGYEEMILKILESAQ